MATVTATRVLQTRQWNLCDQAAVHLTNRDALSRSFGVPLASVSAGTVQTHAAVFGRDPGADVKAAKASTVLTYTVTVP